MPQPVAPANAGNSARGVSGSTGPAWLRFSFAMIGHAPIIIVLCGLCGVGLSACNHRPDGELAPQGADQIKIHYSDENRSAQLSGHPFLEGSINGVKGYFVIDTGTAEAILTMSAVRSCAIHLSDTSLRGGSFGTTNIPMGIATNITVCITPDFSIHWDVVLVVRDDQDVDTNYFGLIGYGTLRTFGATLDSEDKTITFKKHQAFQMAMANTNFGTALPSAKVNSGDTEINTAMEKARITFATEFLPAVMQDRRRSTPLLSDVHVKAFFRGAGSPPPQEMMWLEFVGFDGNNITGLLLNEPEHVPGIRRGHLLSIRQEQLTDWAYVENGKMKGAFSERILRSRLSEQQRRLYDSEHPYPFE